MKLKSLLEVIEAKEVVDICVPDKKNPDATPRTIYYGKADYASENIDLYGDGYLDDQVKWVVSYLDHPAGEIFEEYSVIMIVLPENRTD